ncbi:hypothetical protein GDO78_013188 [Eleutherodactylus coqui]|uniref:Uncharacterized protein n=1 Tax=Eleutherodactylus coqui TaxID=57060 RepID=A0A8J6EZ29_ELECQ|nr:hypothetical protein GDO78_013188 [Eleutherodactylus coqui]
MIQNDCIQQCIQKSPGASQSATSVVGCQQHINETLRLCKVRNETTYYLRVYLINQSLHLHCILSYKPSLERILVIPNPCWVIWRKWRLSSNN